MAEITRQELREVVAEALEPFAQSVQKDFQGVNAKLGGIEARA